MFAPSTDYGLTKTAQDTAPSVKVGFLVFFLFKTDLVYDLFFKVTPQLTICVNYMPINYVSAKVHFCLVKYKYILTSQGSLIRTSPHKGSGVDRRPLARKDVCEGAQNS